MYFSANLFDNLHIHLMRRNKTKLAEKGLTEGIRIGLVVTVKEKSGRNPFLESLYLQHRQFVD